MTTDNDRRRLSPDEVEQRLKALSGWSLAGGVASASADASISKRFEFADFHQTMAFVNAVAWIAHRADHHPDMAVSYKHCQLRYSTHSAGGLTALDFAAAAAVDALLA